MEKEKKALDTKPFGDGANTSTSAAAAEDDYEDDFEDNQEAPAEGTTVSSPSYVRESLEEAKWIDSSINAGHQDAAADTLQEGPALVAADAPLPCRRRST